MTGQLLVGPTSHYYYAQRLKLHYVDWGNPEKPLLVLVHGTRDHARNWDWVAQALREDYHVIALDLRGHGESEWARGSEYSMIEYVVDVTQLLAQLDAFPVTLIGHSLGGGIVLQYSGVYPEHVSKLVAIEGLGPPLQWVRQQTKPAHLRMGEWVGQMRDLASRQPRRYKSLDEAVRRMREVDPRLTYERANHLTLHGVHRNEDGTYTWKFDNYVRARSPYRFNYEDAAEIWNRITCPTLLVRGEESMAAGPENDGRLSEFQNAQVATIPKAGHWLHHDQLEHFLQVVRKFLSS